LSISSQLIAPLAYFKRADLSLAGGKGANLGELLRAGFDVPSGFVVTTEAYDLWLESDSLQPRLPKLLDSLKSGDFAALTQTSQEIREILKRVPVPVLVAQKILDAYHRLGNSPVAVRSSATAEDLPGAAFAGQQETFLNIVGEAALLDAVRACWASLWSERAVLYRARQNVEQTTVKLAVVVQQMVPADVAGVMFTANPVSGARDEILIDASPGLGEAVVAGMVTPDHFVLGKKRKRIQEQRIGRKEIIIRPKAGGGTEQVFPAAEELTSAALSPAAIRKLAQLGMDIEQHYGEPQDIEWAWVKDGTKMGKFLILQARPMTALPEPLKIKVSGPMRMVLPMLAEMWPVRPYPLDMTTFTGVLERAVGNFLAVMIGKSAPDPDKALLEEDGVVVRFEPPEFRPSPGLLITPWITFWRTRHYDPSRWEQDALLAEVKQQGQELNERNPALLTWEENIQMLHEALALIPRVMQLRERYFPQAILGLGSLWILLTFAHRSDRFGILLGGIETKTTETNRALQNLAAQIRSDPILHNLFTHTPAEDLQSVLADSEAGRVFLKHFAAFLTEYGHRETALTISEGAWKDQPQVVLEILKIQVAAPPQEPDSYQAWKRTRDELLAHSILRRWPFRNWFLKALTNGRSLFQMREDTHFYATLAQPPVRHIALELGRRLGQVGVLDSAEEILHLRLDELEGLGQTWPPTEETRDHIRGLIAQRRAKREALANIPMVDPRLLAVESQGYPDAGILLSGSPGSPGKASGPARIVHNSSEFGKLQPGDVLVAPVTNPAWTPLFQHAAAVVVDTGGAASHAAIVAREYGVPAVMGTLNGTQQLTDGQWVQVDGSRGLVLKVEEKK
jgi:rifampicin phosphotransferase